MQSIEPKIYSSDELSRILAAIHYQPHAVLGLHHFSEEKKSIRLWRPGAQQIFLEVLGEIVEARKIDDAGLLNISSLPLQFSPIIVYFT